MTSKSGTPQNAKSGTKRQLPSNLFVLKKANRKFLKGERKTFAMFNWIAFIVLFVPLLLVSVAFGIYDLTLPQQLEQEGHTVSGLITGVNVSDKGDRSITYTFTAEQGPDAGKEFTQTQQLIQNAPRELKKDSFVRVRYLVSDPRTARLTGADAELAFNDPFLRYLLVASIIGIVVVIIYGIIGSIKNHRLARKGRVVLGRLTGFTYASNGAFGTVGASYTLTLPDGRQVHGEGSTARPNADWHARLARPESGTPVAVLYVDESTHQLL